MEPGTTLFGQGSPDRRQDPPPSTARGVHSADSAHQLRELCVSAFPLNFRLPTVNSNSSKQVPCFDNLPHSSTTTQNSPLYFHNLTNSSPSRKNSNSLIFNKLHTLWPKHRGCIPSAQRVSERILELQRLSPMQTTTRRSHAEMLANFSEIGAIPCAFAEDLL